MKNMLWTAGAGLLCIASAASASERVAVVPGASNNGPTETLAVEISARDGLLWSGTLTIGPRYGNASFSQSKSEAVLPCEGKQLDPNNNTNVNSSFNLNFSRSNWQQTPHRFNVNFNRNMALPACEGQGTDSSGFNRVVEILPGSSTTIRGKNGVTVTVSRP